MNNSDFDLIWWPLTKLYVPIFSMLKCNWIAFHFKWSCLYFACEFIIIRVKLNEDAALELILADGSLIYLDSFRTMDRVHTSVALSPFHSAEKWRDPNIFLWRSSKWLCSNTTVRFDFSRSFTVYFDSSIWLHMPNCGSISTYIPTLTYRIFVASIVKCFIAKFFFSFCPRSDYWR